MPKMEFQSELEKQHAELLLGSSVIVLILSIAFALSGGTIGGLAKNVSGASNQIDMPVMEKQEKIELGYIAPDTPKSFPYGADGGGGSR